MMRAETTTLLREIHESSLRQEGLLLEILRALGNPGREKSEALIKCIYDLKGSRAFLAADIVLDCDAMENESLKNAILDAIGQTNVRKLGKLFESIEGEDFNGVKIRRYRNTRDGLLWRFEKYNQNPQTRECFLDRMSGPARP
jgi:hypothetical protein